MPDSFVAICELAKSIFVQNAKTTAKSIALHEKSAQMGLFCWRLTNSAEQSSWHFRCIRCVCTSGNSSSRNGYSDAHFICHIPSKPFNSTNNVDIGNTANKEGVNMPEPSEYAIF